jgi:hypothetical protein
VGIFKDTFDITVMQLILNEVNKYAQQEILKHAGFVTFYTRTRKWENVIVGNMYVVLALCISMV